MKIDPNKTIDVIVAILAVCIVVVMMACVGCVRKYEDPPLYTYDTPMLVLLSAQAEAIQRQGFLMTVSDTTHSMEPTLMGNDIIVVVKVPIDSIVKGNIVVYKADWLPASAPPVAHRVAVREFSGLLMSGDNAARSEPRFRVTGANYLGKVVSRYRLKK